MFIHCTLFQVPADITSLTRVYKPTYSTPSIHIEDADFLVGRLSKFNKYLAVSLPLKGQ